MQLGVQPVGVPVKIIGRSRVVGVGVADGFGQVLGQVADGPVRVGGGGDDAAHVGLGAEPHHVRRLRVRVGGQLVDDFVPGRQHHAGVRVDVVLCRPTPAAGGRRRAGRGRPPHLDVGGADDLAEQLARDGAADRGVQVRREALLGFDGGEVLDLVAGAAAQVLPEPVDQLREVQRVQRGPPVVIASRADRGTVADRAVGRQGQGEEHRRPVLPAVGGGEHPADGAVLDRHPRQVGSVIPAPGRPHPPIHRLCHDRHRSPDHRSVVVRRASVEGSVPVSGSSVRCQPSAHCCIRSTRALCAQGGQTASRVDPHGDGRRSGRCRCRGRGRGAGCGRMQTCSAMASSRAMSAVIEASTSRLMRRPARGGGRPGSSPGRCRWCHPTPPARRRRGR